MLAGSAHLQQGASVEQSLGLAWRNALNTKQQNQTVIGDKNTIHTGLLKGAQEGALAGRFHTFAVNTKGAVLEFTSPGQRIVDALSAELSEIEGMAVEAVLVVDESRVLIAVPQSMMDSNADIGKVLDTTEALITQEVGVEDEVFNYHFGTIDEYNPTQVIAANLDNGIVTGYGRLTFRGEDVIGMFTVGGQKLAFTKGALFDLDTDDVLFDLTKLRGIPTVGREVEGKPQMAFVSEEGYAQFMLEPNGDFNQIGDYYPTPAVRQIEGMAVWSTPLETATGKRGWGIETPKA